MMATATLSPPYSQSGRARDWVYELERIKGGDHASVTHHKRIAWDEPGRIRLSEQSG